ncbi:serine/threonine-protein kinase [Ornithinibacillus halophilus]|uniref:NIMA (Never in mitosis gene a)-related kinase/serine/threonine protein kinase n=1 Tax=Ornithinibacillus halophilus TaxID=930117 RepID=A0A1M5GTP3_9BACI|nr:serine/threonine-protein kinase [Ornithinibacillus halophilus]SHG07106.1 NIMA (never in mitosis gene a)-related kinase/serine/threonine protein kinase [Ornithinibacillus halophilus]
MRNLSYEAKHSYRIMKTIYETDDGTSAFYEAFDDIEKRKVGIKAVAVAPKDLQKAKSEALTLHRFATMSTSIPALYHTYYDQKQERFYLIMQLIEQGRTLEHMLQGTIPIHQSLQILIDLCDALIPLHQKKYQHRDLKPANIMVQNRNVYLIDFNLTSSKPFKGEGTTFYRSPEQDINSKGVGQDKTDIFSIGVIFYQMVTGHLPVRGQEYVPDRSGKKWRFFTKPIEKNKRVPQEISDLIEKCMQINPNDRPVNANELKRLLIQLKRRVR